MCSPAVLALCSVLALVPVTSSQVAAGHARRILKTIKPEYPVVLKNKGIGGVVRLNVRVLANGNVASVSISGGNPILADSAAKSIMTWKFEPAMSVSNEVVTFDFNVH